MSNLDDIESYSFVCLPMPDLNFVFAIIVISLVGNHLHSHTNLITHQSSKQNYSQFITQSECNRRPWKRMLFGKRKNIRNGQVETSGRFHFNEEPLGFDF
jgi:hypothetical protein